LWLKIFSRGYEIKNLDEYLVLYRIRTGQTKSENLKQTLRNTIFIQQRAIKEYHISPSFSDRMYHVSEKILLVFPNSFILFLFMKLEYSHE